MIRKQLYICGLLVAMLFPFASHIAYGQSTPDPGLPGTMAVTKAEYNLGDLAFSTSSFPDPMEVRGSVHYPTGLSGGPYPVIVFLHGRHETCYETSDPTNTSQEWPCPSGWQSIVSYAGYDYLARQMASHGYIVISISCNAINATDAPSNNYGMPARGELVQHHLDLWNAWNTTGTGPFGSTFIGKLNMQNIGTMGHSRGGEGVVYNALYNRSVGSPYGIRAVFTLAPVDFKRKVLNGIPLLNLAPYCDGDVSDLQGVHFYDNARYTDTTDEAPKHNILFMGANHNFFNTVWTPGSYIAGGADDWDDYIGDSDPYCGTAALSNKRFDTTRQKAALNTYLSAFFRIYLGHETQFSPILNVNDIIPPASSTLDTSNVFVSYHPGRTNRTDINRTDSSYSLTTNALTGTVTSGGLTAYSVCGGGLAEATCGVSTHADQEPHKGTSALRGLSQVKIRWNDTTDFYENDIPPAYQDLTYVQSLQFRAAENFSLLPSGTKLNFTVTLIDSLGDSSSHDISSISHALFYQPGTETAELPKIVFNTIQLPLSGFTGISLAHVRKIKFRFNRSAAGAILISDLAFVNQQCGKLNAKFGYTLSSSHIATFTDSTTASYGDTVTRTWHFGNPASGIADTSTAPNPMHLYSAYGTYTACQYVRSARRNGTVCLDTFCTAVHITPPALVTMLAAEEITIVPNPAAGYIQIYGAANDATIKLINNMGQVVLTATLAGQAIALPASLPNGVYYALVAGSKGNVYKKIVVSR